MNMTSMLESLIRESYNRIATYTSVILNILLAIICSIPSSVICSLIASACPTLPEAFSHALVPILTVIFIVLVHMSDRSRRLRLLSSILSFVHWVVEHIVSLFESKSMCSTLVVLALKRENGVVRPLQISNISFARCPYSWYVLYEVARGSSLGRDLIVKFFGKIIELLTFLTYPQSEEDRDKVRKCIMSCSEALRPLKLTLTYTEAEVKLSRLFKCELLPDYLVKLSREVHIDLYFSESRKKRRKMLELSMFVELEPLSLPVVMAIGGVALELIPYILNVRFKLRFTTHPDRSVKVRNENMTVYELALRELSCFIQSEHVLKMLDFAEYMRSRPAHEVREDIARILRENVSLLQKMSSAAVERLVDELLTQLQLLVHSPRVQIIA